MAAELEPAPNISAARTGRVSWWWLPISIAATAAVTAAITIAAFGAVTPAAPASVARATFTMNGGITVVSSGGDIQEEDNGGCAGRGGYSDMTAGTAVTVQDSHGATIATGSLSDGTFADPNVSQNCVFPFTVQGVPDGLTQYEVTVSHRGTQVVAASDAHNDVELTLGG